MNRDILLRDPSVVCIRRVQVHKDAAQHQLTLRGPEDQSSGSFSWFSVVKIRSRNRKKTSGAQTRSLHRAETHPDVFPVFRAVSEDSAGDPDVTNPKAATCHKSEDLQLPLILRP